LFDEKIYQLTWQAKKGFVYDLKSFQLLDSFAYGKSEEGWGLTHNEKGIDQIGWNRTALVFGSRNPERNPLHRSVYQQKESGAVE
jgi:glutamine cyclotransferase